MPADDKRRRAQDDVITRFIELLEEEKQIWWSTQLGVSPGILSNSWKAGKLPRVETLIKLLKLKDISANWLFFGIGPKYLKDMDEDLVRAGQDKTQETQRKILEKEERIFELTQQVQRLERAVKQYEVATLVDPQPPSGDDESRSMLESNIMPMMAFNKLFLDVLYKAFEHYMTNEMDNTRMRELLDWFRETLPSSHYHVKASLKELENVFGRESD